MSEWHDYRWENMNERLSKLEQTGIPGLRDFFATSALSILAGEHSVLNKHSEIAKYCYDIADAMIKERSKDVSTVAK